MNGDWNQSCEGWFLLQKCLFQGELDYEICPERFKLVSGVVQIKLTYLKLFLFVETFCSHRRYLIPHPGTAQFYRIIASVRVLSYAQSGVGQFKVGLITSAYELKARTSSHGYIRAARKRGIHSALISRKGISIRAPGNSNFNGFSERFRST